MFSIVCVLCNEYEFVIKKIWFERLKIMGHPNVKVAFSSLNRLVLLHAFEMLQIILQCGTAFRFEDLNQTLDLLVLLHLSAIH